MDTLAGIRKSAGPYPIDLLEGCETALLLFGAGFLGINDGIHIADAGMHAVVVDTDGDKLERMSTIYPSSWNYYLADAWWLSEQIASRFDVVSVDTWTGDMSARSMQSLHVWCSLANKLVTATKSRKDKFSIPYGWEPSIIRRSGRADWLVLEPGL